MKLAKYIAACHDQPNHYAVISVPMAAEHLGITRSAVLERIKAGNLSEVVISGESRAWRMVLLSSLVGRAAKQQSKEKILMQEIQTLLAEVAKHERTIPYGELMSQVGMTYMNPQDRGEIGRILCEISEFTHEEHGFLLSVLAVRKKTGLPNNAFFKLAVDIGAMDDDDDPEDFFDTQLDLVFKHHRPSGR